MEQIYEILCALIDLCAETSGPLSPVLLDAMAKFAEYVHPFPPVEFLGLIGFQDFAENRNFHAIAAGYGQA
jgi:hypothetical protein